MPARPAFPPIVGGQVLPGPVLNGLSDAEAACRHQRLCRLAHCHADPANSDGLRFSVCSYWKYLLMMSRSGVEGCRPFKLASMTRRQISAVASSLRSVAASRTVRAVSSVPSCLEASISVFAPPPFLPKLSAADLPNTGTALPNVTAFMFVSSHSGRGKCDRLRLAGFGNRAILAGLIECKNASRRLDVEAAVLAFQVSQVLRGDAVIFCAKKQQGHLRLP